MKSLVIVLALTALLLSACGAQSTPTIDPAQVQASAMAAANTMVAQTQAAIPPTPVATDTPLATDTPQPSPTSLELPTLANFPTAAPLATSSTGANCNVALSKPQGPKNTTVKIQNSTKSLVTISLYLAITKFADCGYVSYVINGNNSVVLVGVLPLGCYSSYAFSQDPKHSFHVSSGPDCITGPDKTTFNITTTGLKVSGP